MKILRTCPICGKKFNPCRTSIKATGVFNWREITCSFQCGQEYLTKLEKEKNPTNPTEFVNAVLDDVDTLTNTDELVAEETETTSLTSTKSKKKSK